MGSAICTCHADNVPLQSSRPSTHEDKLTHGDSSARFNANRREDSDAAAHTIANDIGATPPSPSPCVSRTSVRSVVPMDKDKQSSRSPPPPPTAVLSPHHTSLGEFSAQEEGVGPRSHCSIMSPRVEPSHHRSTHLSEGGEGNESEEEEEEDELTGANSVVLTQQTMLQPPRQGGALLFGLAIPTILTNSINPVATSEIAQNPFTPHRQGGSSADFSKSFDASAPIPPMPIARSNSMSSLLRGGRPPVVIRVAPTLSASEHNHSGGDVSAPKLYVFRQQSSHLYSNGALCCDENSQTIASESDASCCVAAAGREGTAPLAIHSFPDVRSSSSGGWGGSGGNDAERHALGSNSATCCSDIANAPCELSASGGAGLRRDGDPLTPLVVDRSAATTHTAQCSNDSHVTSHNPQRQHHHHAVTHKVPSVGFVELARFASLQ